MKKILRIVFVLILAISSTSFSCDPTLLPLLIKEQAAHPIFDAYLTLLPPEDYKKVVKTWEVLTGSEDAASVTARTDIDNLGIVEEYLFEYPDRVSAVKSDFVQAPIKQDYITDLLGPGVDGDIVKHRVTGLYEGIDEFDDIGGKLIDIIIGPNARYTEVEVIGGENAVFVRSYVPEENKFVFNAGFIEEAPSWMDNGQVPLIFNKGMPTQMLVTLRQMKSLNIPDGSLQIAKMSTIHNKETILWLAKMIKENENISDYNDIGNLIFMAPSKSLYPISVLKQVGYRVKTGNLADGFDPSLPLTETTLGEIIAEGKFKMTESDLAAFNLELSDKTYYNFDINFTLESF